MIAGPELERMKQVAMAEMVKHQPAYPSAMAGAAFSGTIWAALDTLFADLEEARQHMPAEFDPNLSADILANVDATATAYLATDLLRPRAGWSFSAKKRALKRELQDTLDKRAMIAALSLKQARVYLDLRGGSKSVSA